MTSVSRGPDENAYLDHAIVFREEGPAGVLKLIGEYFANAHSEQERPSPLRWGAMLIGSLFVRLNEEKGLVWASRLFSGVSALLMGALAYHFGAQHLWAIGILLGLSSPLLSSVRDKMFVESWVAASALGALLAFSTHHLVLGMMILGVLLSLKESAVLLSPGILLPAYGEPPLHLALGLMLVGVFYVAGFYAVGGRQLVKLFRVARKSHGHSYTRAFQSGPPHRVLVDLALVSPLALIVGAFFAHESLLLAASAFTMLLTHAFAPLKNVRVLVTVDLLLRVLIALGLSRLPWWIAAMSGAALIVFDDLLVFRTLRAIYDPVTAELVSGFKMVPKAIWKVEL